MWTCPKCGEKIEDQFDTCWKCAAPPEQPAPPVSAVRRCIRFFLLGLLFEAFLIALGFLMPECWLEVEIGNFYVITHYPMMVMMMFVADTFHIGEDPISGILLILVGFAVMGAIWGSLIYLVTRLIKAVTARLSQRQKMVFKYSLGLFSLAVLLWAIASMLPATPISFTASPEVKSTVDGNTAFALDLYQKLKEQPGNLFFSPYSISTSLAMTYAGARGQTETEMARALHFNLAQTNLPAAFSELAARMSQIERWNRITLKTANSLWCQRDYQFTDAFLSVIHKFYRAEARQFDFIHSPQAAADEINGWVERQTNRKIKDAVAPSQFTDLTRLILCDAIYFKGKWQHQFKVSDTKPAPFNVTTNQTVTVPMMHQKAHFKMARRDDDSVELLELPYSGTDLSMIILLPQIEYPPPDVQNPGLSDLEQKLNADNLRAWLAKLDQARPHETWVTLPRFTTSQGFDLVKELKSLGMVSAFDSTANFYGMDGTTNLFVSDVIHKSFVEVNESGTEAAAVNLVLVKTKGMADRFIVDHPFIFLIRENGSGTILFIGRIVDPTR
jgi:serpin B